MKTKKVLNFCLLFIYRYINEGLNCGHEESKKLNNMAHQTVGRPGSAKTVLMNHDEGTYLEDI